MDTGKIPELDAVILHEATTNRNEREATSMD
jgi:hypothetical protein